MKEQYFILTNQNSSFKINSYILISRTKETSKRRNDLGLEKKLKDATLRAITNSTHV